MTTCNSGIINDMAIKRNKRITTRLSDAEEEVVNEIARRTGALPSAAIRQAALEKGEKMGIPLKHEDAPAKSQGGRKR